MTRELWVRFLAGETLSAEEQAAVVAALEADPQLRAELLEDLQVDGSLRALGDARRSGAKFAADVVECVGPERDATRFIRKVEARLAELPPEPTSSKRDSRSNLPRVSRRFWRRDAETAGWRSALAAAAVFAAIVLLATAFSSKPAPRPRDPLGARAPLPEPLPPTPPAPEPAPERLLPGPPPSREPERGPEKKDPEPLVVPPPKLADATPPQPLPPPLPPAAPPPTRSAEEAKIARGPVFVDVVDQVYWAKEQTRPKKGDVLEYGREFYATGRGTALLRYDDGTTVLVKTGVQARDLSGSAGRHFDVLLGEIESDIQRQPAGQPMLFSTPHGKATILGTRIRLSVSKDPAAGTTLNVDEGLVRFQRNDGRSVEVAAGQMATASAVHELRTRIAFPKEFMVRFGPSDVPNVPGVLLDSGEAHTPARAYGWDATRDGQTLPNAKQPDGSPVLTGRRAEWKLDPRMPLKRDDPKSSVVVAGWGEHAERWKIELPNGRYEVTVGVGDSTFEQGPHVVAVEGVLIVNHVLTKPGKLPHYENTQLVEVNDGELNMRVGGSPRPQKSSDTSKDTLLHYLVIKRAPAK